MPSDNRLSPFELKNTLIELATHRGERMMLNAGRGNPNWVALAPRAALVRLGEFALVESAREALGDDLGGLPKKRGIARRLRVHLESGTGDGGTELLLRGIELATERFGCDPDRLVGEWVDGVLGDHYPVPVRMLPHAERLVRGHLAVELGCGEIAFDLFAVEGASAGIVYLFQSLVTCGALVPGDRIALGVPTFTPYLDLPRLDEYRFEVVPVVQDEAADWRYSPAELEKLRDPRVKAFLAVNPSNPTAVSIDADSLRHIAAIVRERPDLLLISDDVYAPFVEDFRSLAGIAPRNTVVIYSFSKYWGATGLRLGVVALARDNVIDAMLSGRDGDAQAASRYGCISSDPAALCFIDRMVADSRGVGLNHTAGLSTPQQVQMALLALDALLDASGTRKQAVRALLRRRFEQLYRGAGLAAPDHALMTRYYATLDIPALARNRHGAEFSCWLVDRHEAHDFVMRLAREHGIVLMDGGGFDAPRMSVRVSLANLPDTACAAIGRAIIELIDDYHRHWLAEAFPEEKKGAT